MKTIRRDDFQKIGIDKDDDLIAITVRQWKCFMSNGIDGINGSLLYLHLIFTARLQETNQVKAKDKYICKGLSWGADKTRRTKSWLVKNGFIEYVRIRNPDGTLGEVYIKINFLLSHLYRHIDSGGDEATTGLVSNPVVEPASGYKRQMLKEININSLSVVEETLSRSICEKWYSAYSKYAQRDVRPKSGDYAAAIKLIQHCPELSDDISDSLIDKAISNHFEKWKNAWFLTVDVTRPLPESSRQPYWNFRNFCNYFIEILNLDLIELCSIGEKNAKSKNIASAKRGAGISGEARESIIRKVEDEIKGGKV